MHSSSEWTAETLEAQLSEQFSHAGGILFNHAARLSDKTRIQESSPRYFDVMQALVTGAQDDEQDALALDVFVDLQSGPFNDDGPLIQLRGLINQ